MVEIGAAGNTVFLQSGLEHKIETFFLLFTQKIAFRFAFFCNLAKTKKQFLLVSGRIETFQLLLPALQKYPIVVCNFTKQRVKTIEKQ